MPPARIAIASRVAGLAAPVAGVTPQLDDEARLLADLALVAPPRLRRQAVHPPAAGRADPRGARARAQKPIDWARRVLAAEAASPGAAQLDGRMVDRPVVLQAAAHAAAAPAPESSLTPHKEPTMPSTIIDSAIFQGIFSSDAMRQVWSDENRTQKYLDIERALAKVQGRLGLIPQEAADEIVSHCRLDQIDMAKLRAQTERIGYPILGVVSQLNALCRDKLGEYCHWGATTQDITDTATVLQIREGARDRRRASSRRSRRRWPSSRADAPRSRR